MIHRCFDFMPMRYVIKMNADVWSRLAPEESVPAILVHELAYEQQLSRGMRVHREWFYRHIPPEAERQERPTFSRPRKSTPSAGAHGIDRTFSGPGVEGSR